MKWWTVKRCSKNNQSKEFEFQFELDVKCFDQRNMQQQKNMHKQINRQTNETIKYIDDKLY